MWKWLFNLSLRRSVKCHASLACSISRQHSIYNIFRLQCEPCGHLNRTVSLLSGHTKWKTNAFQMPTENDAHDIWHVFSFIYRIYTLSIIYYAFDWRIAGNVLRARWLGHARSIRNRKQPWLHWRGTRSTRLQWCSLFAVVLKIYWREHLGTWKTNALSRKANTKVDLKRYCDFFSSACERVRAYVRMRAFMCVCMVRDAMRLPTSVLAHCR